MKSPTAENPEAESPKAQSPKALGYLDGRTHILPISVYYEDTDLSGMVYHANYLRFMERGRTEFFRSAGIARAALDDAEPTAWTLRRAALEFHRPARLDDRLLVHTDLVGLSGVRLTVRQRVTCGAALLVAGRIEACIVTLSGKPCRLSKNTVETLAPFLSAEET